MTETPSPRRSINLQRTMLLACRGVTVATSVTTLLALYLSAPIIGVTVTLAILAIFFWLAIKLIRMLVQHQWSRFSMRSLILSLSLVAGLIVLSRDGPAWQLVHEFVGLIPTTVFSPDAQLVATISNAPDPTIDISKTRTSQQLASLRLPGIQPMSQIAFSKDNKSLLMMTAGIGGSARLVDWKSGSLIRTWSTSRAGYMAANGERFFMYTNEASTIGAALCVFQSDRDEPLLTVPQPAFWQGLPEDNISSTGRYVLVRGEPDVVQLWNVDTKQQVGALRGHDFAAANRPLTFAQFSPDDRYLALATNRGVEIWDVERFQQIGLWEPDGFSRLGALDWSPSGDRLFAMHVEATGATTGREHSALIDRTGREIVRVDGSSAVFSPAGDRIAVQHGSVAILDGQSGSVLTRLGPGRTPLSIPGHRAIFFSSDGEWLLHNGAAAVWHRQRNERWYGIFSVPAFWVVDLVLIAMCWPLSTRQANWRRQTDRPADDRNEGVR